MTAVITDHFPLRQGRAHEVCGAGAYGFTCALAGQLGGHVMWIREDWQPEMLNPEGFSPFFDPRKLLFAKGKSQADVLASGEEALRSGAVKLTVMELSKPIGLTEGRRLQLAAEAGKSTGLCIISEGMGSNAAESRWRCAPIFDPADSTLIRWEIIKNKSGTLAGWNLRWDAEACRITMVSKAGQRSAPADARG
jgi:protein ImuA